MKKKQVIYIITVISAYEDIYTDAPLDLKGLENALVAHEKKYSKTDFMKKINRRWIIRDFTSGTKSMHNPYSDEKGHRSSRPQMFFFKKEDAIKALKTNYTDIWEGGSWGNPTFAVIEETCEGFSIQDTKKRWFYEAKFERSGNSTKFKVKKIKEPVWAKRTVNYGI